MIKSIPLNKLVQSPRNVRRHSDPAADTELKASIAAHGLLQNLIVRPAAKGKFEVEAGERRRRAMLALADGKLLARDHEVTCLVLEDSAEAAVETSLAENFHRLAMNPADEAQAFAALVAGGATVEEVARRFGLTVLSRVNATREELRYVSAYRPGMVLDVRSPDKHQRLPRGEYRVESVDEKTREVFLRDGKGKIRTLRPSRIRPGAKDDRLALFEEKRLSIHAGDRIRWTENDHRRGLFNADQARIETVEGSRVTLVTSTGLRHELERSDPMLRRLDLAYALNAHMAQGLTSDRGIAVMDSRERNLANQQTFLVTVTRLRDHLTLVVDSTDKLGKAVAQNTGEKTSALEVTERLREAAAKGLAAGAATQEDQRKQPPELTKERTKPFEMGI